jgi:spoIIIJ-associated protein
VETNAKINATDREDIAEKASEFLLGVLERMGITADIEVREDGDRIVLEVQTADTELVIGQRGVVVDALQHVVNKVVYKERAGRRDDTTERGKPFIVDAGGYRDKQVERLRGVAQRTGEKVLETGSMVELAPMTAHDRRIVHMAIAELFPGLTTRSEGEGDDRHITVLPGVPGAAAAPPTRGESSSESSEP